MTTEVKRIDGEWKRGEDKIDYSIASTPFTRWSRSTLPRSSPGPTPPPAASRVASPRLEIELEAEKVKEKLVVYPAQGELAAATVEGRDSVPLLPNDKIAELEAKIATLRTAKPGETAPPAPPPGLGDDPAEGESEE